MGLFILKTILVLFTALEVSVIALIITLIAYVISKIIEIWRAKWKKI